MIDLLSWLVALQLLGILSFPIAFKLFPCFPDRGYAFQKIIGLILLAYFVWIIGSIRIFPITQSGIFLVLIGLGIASVAIAYRERSGLAIFFRKNWALVLTIEGTFLLVFMGWLLFHSYDPFIEHTEQVMDFALLSSSQRTLFFPPEDPWLRGSGLNYYYFGYVIFGTLGKIVGTPNSVTYNLTLASIPALSASAVLGLIVGVLKNSGSSKKNAICFGVAGVGILLFIGNLEPLFEMVHSFGFGWAGLWELLKVPGLGTVVAGNEFFPSEPWWWWRATRVIHTTVNGNLLDYGINEFPFFSFLIGDLHPHLVAIPFTFLVIGTSLNFFFDRSKPNLSWMTRHAGMIVMMGLFLGGLGFINTWSLPPLFFLVSLFALGKVFRDGGVGRIGFNLSWYAGLISVLTFLSIILFLPYYMNLDAIPINIQLVKGPGTQMIHGILLWGCFIIVALPVLSYFLSLMITKFSRPTLIAALGISIFPMFPTLLLNPSGISVSPMIFSCFLILLVGVYTCIQAVRRTDEDIVFIMAAFLIFASLLVLGPELYLVGDSFQSRMNTIFKFHYQAWIVLALLSPLLLFYSRKLLFDIHGIRKVLEPIWITSLILIMVISGYYDVGSSIDKTNGFSAIPSLDGLSKVNSENPGEFAVIHWLLNHSQPGEGLVEAVGPDYSNFGRISAATGVSTILGWVGHERQWRGPSWNPSFRLNDVKSIYQSSNDEEFLMLLKRYDITYVILGPRERSTYPAQNLAAKTNVLEIAFSEDDYLIYRLKADMELYEK